MSNWKKIEDAEDVSISDDNTTIDVYIGSDEFGNNYIEIPMTIIEKIMRGKGWKCPEEVEIAELFSYNQGFESALESGVK